MPKTIEELHMMNLRMAYLLGVIDAFQYLEGVRLLEGHGVPIFCVKSSSEEQPSSR